MRVACYIRVSTDEQRTDLQLDALKKYCDFKGWVNPALFTDHGESGKKTSRPALDKMLLGVRASEFDVVLTWKFDRIGRSSAHLISIVEEFRMLGVDFVSVTESIDTTSPIGKMIFTIFAALAEFERETLIMRTRAGIKAAQDRGVHCGREKTVSEATCRDVLYLRSQKHSLDEICQSHPELSRATIGRIIKGIPRGQS